ncbi:MAG: hypothetical protein HZC48_13585 [Nitrospirae bacterium]|nr:hypothetical protein [Nitrospirota bacterium]
MKKTSKETSTSCDIHKRAGFKEAIDKRIEKIKHGAVKCPLCTESFNGIKDMWAHFKEHCR